MKFRLIITFFIAISFIAILTVTHAAEKDSVSAHKAVLKITFKDGGGSDYSDQIVFPEEDLDYYEMAPIRFIIFLLDNGLECRPPKIKNRKLSMDCFDLTFPYTVSSIPDKELSTKNDRLITIISLAFALK